MLKSIITIITTVVLTCSSWAVEIDYWQYSYKSRIDAMDRLIQAFEAMYPDITVKHSNCLLYTSDAADE